MTLLAKRQTTLKRLAWQIQLMGDAMTPLRMLAIASLALWLGLQWQVLVPLQRMQSAYQAELASAKSESTADTGGPVVVSQRLEDVLPALAEREQQIATLMRLAEKKSLSMGRLDYRSERVQGLDVTRQRVKLKLAGSYAAQRAFLNQLLATLPNSAIDKLMLEKRPDQSADMVAILELSLFYRTTAEDFL